MTEFLPLEIRRHIHAQANHRPKKETSASSEQGWLNVEGLAEVEITSEDATHPSNPHCYWVKLRDGGPQRLGNRQSGCCSTIRNGSNGSG